MNIFKEIKEEKTPEHLNRQRNEQNEEVDTRYKNRIE